MEEVYDVVIVGGGANSLSIACYLGKCGLSVCICEARGECGGGCENTEPIPGIRIDPHATYMYGAAAPAFEQLELHKFGFRMVHQKNQAGGVMSDGTAFSVGPYDIEASVNCVKKLSLKDAQIMEMMLLKTILQPQNAVDLLRSMYWTPPPPPHINLRKDELPWAELMRNDLPGIYQDEWNDMSTFEILDTIWESEPLKVMAGYGAWLNGPHPDWKGTGIPGLLCNGLMTYSSGAPRGGMHSYAHAMVRCAMYHGVRVYTNSKVEEIIVESGEAKGVILADNATARARKIFARKAVLSNTHVKPTFLELVPSMELEPDFQERVRGINLIGGSLFVLSLVTTELPQFKGDAMETFANGRWPSTVVVNLDSRKSLQNMGRVAYEENTHPLKLEDMTISITSHSIFDQTHCTKDGLHVMSPIYLNVPPPEYHRDGPEAVNFAKDEIVAAILEKIREVAPTFTDDKIVHTFVNTPYDSTLRNMAFVGGNWMGISQQADQWYEKKPLPELARYRTPIDKLYLCHQSSYPGGLALQAVSYNLMHILIEDLDLKPGEWWYPSPHFIPSDA